MVRAAKLTCFPARTNVTAARVGAVEKFLNRQIDGGPARLLCPEGAKPLITAYRGGYRYRLKKSGDAEDAPEKNNHSHIADADQYACLHADAEQGGNAWSARQQARPVQRVNALGWT
jgi:hypothetical protein